MARASTHSDTMPPFKNAADKRAWLLEQLAAVEKEAVFEDMAAGRNERITIRVGDTLRIDVGGSALYSGTDPAQFAANLAKTVAALPLGSAFVVEAGKGGKTLSGGVSADEGLAAQGPETVPASRRRPRKAQIHAA